MSCCLGILLATIELSWFKRNCRSILQAVTYLNRQMWLTWRSNHKVAVTSSKLSRFRVVAIMTIMKFEPKLRLQRETKPRTLRLYIGYSKICHSIEIEVKFREKRLGDVANHRGTIHFSATDCCIVQIFLAKFVFNFNREIPRHLHLINPSCVQSHYCRSRN